MKILKPIGAVKVFADGRDPFPPTVRVDAGRVAAYGCQSGEMDAKVLNFETNDFKRGIDISIDTLKEIIQWAMTP